MKITIAVSNRNEGELILRGLEDPAVRAFVIVIGALSSLPSDRARARILRYFSDRLDEDRPEIPA
jgi:hypothetical protein